MKNLVLLLTLLPVLCSAEPADSPEQAAKMVDKQIAQALASTRTARESANTSVNTRGTDSAKSGTLEEIGAALRAGQDSIHSANNPPAAGAHPDSQ